jgi:bifunctional DNA-binding transcriptional regulator/antitoxin component of YhaV-PrlF toxin-antitoxin module
MNRLVKIEEDGGITMPPDVLMLLDLKDGDPISISYDAFQIVIRKIDENFDSSTSQ